MFDIFYNERGERKISAKILHFQDNQVAQNQVKVATDGSFCADTTFVQTPLKIFLFTLRLRSRYLKGTPQLALYASKKIGTIRCTDRIILKEK